MSDANGDPRVAAGEQPRRGRFGQIESFEQVVMNVSFVALLFATCWGVLSRYVVTTPAAWAEEVSSISFAWLIFVGAAEVHRRAQHVSVDLLTNTLPARVQFALARLVDGFVVVFCFYVAYLGAKQTYVSHAATTSILRIPLSVSFSGLTLGFFLMGVRGAQRLFNVLGARSVGR